MSTHLHQSKHAIFYCTFNHAKLHLVCVYTTYTQREFGLYLQSVDYFSFVANKHRVNSNISEKPTFKATTERPVGVLFSPLN